MSTTLPVGKITVDSDATEFWDRIRERNLSLQRCTQCSTVRYPPRHRCPACLNDGTEWIPVAGTGTVYTFVVYERAFKPELKEHLPYVAALIELEEGVRMWSNIMGMDDPYDVYIGMPVSLIYEEVDGQVIPRFVAAD